jgi:hypothetical protein
MGPDLGITEVKEFNLHQYDAVQEQKLCGRGEKQN